MSSTDPHSPFAFIPQAQPARMPSALRLTVWLLLLALFIAGGCRYLINQSEARNLQQRTKAGLKRTVIATHSKPGDKSRKLVLPASLRGNTETQLYARSNGYLRAWYKTIGDTVAKGELLAEIDIPELEQELAQARVSIGQIKVRLDLARSTLKRWTILKDSDSVIQQEYDEKRSAVLQAEADLEAAKVNLRRLEQISAYRRITAPFAGVVTRRSVDIGSLINAGSQELFALAQINPLRLSVWIPQSYADEIKTGQTVKVNIAESRKQTYSARVDHIAGALDPVTRTRQVDITLDNRDNRFLPGAYVEVSIDIVSQTSPLVVPANTLIVDHKGAHVMVIGADQRLRLRDVTLGHDFGRTVEIVDGITPADVLVASPSDLLVEGESVNSIEAEPKKPAKTEKDARPS